MSNPLDKLLEAVKGSVLDHADRQKHTGFDPSDLVGSISDLFGNHKKQHGNVLPASRDPYGDPADQGRFGHVKPASQDPYGDPADQERFGNVKPASQDPYGDPADQERKRR